MKGASRIEHGYFWGHFGDKVMVRITDIRRFKGKWLKGIVVEDDHDFYGPFVWVKPAVFTKRKRSPSDSLYSSFTPAAQAHVIWKGRASGDIKLGWVS